jgi:hypothetical protein
MALKEIVCAAFLALAGAGCIHTTETVTKETPIVITVATGYRIRPNIRTTFNGKQYLGVAFEDGSIAAYLEKSILYKIGEAQILKIGKDLQFINCKESEALFDKKYENFRKLLDNDFLEYWKKDYEDRNPAY